MRCMTGEELVAATRDGWLARYLYQCAGPWLEPDVLRRLLLPLINLEVCLQHFQGEPLAEVMRSTAAEIDAILNGEEPYAGATSGRV
jgi:hypothetical protein